MTHLTRRDALLRGGAMAGFLPMISACAPEKAKAATAAEPLYTDGVRMAELIATGEMTALEAVNAAIDRAETVNPQINAIASETYEMAREMAANTPEGRLAGVPSFIKDLNDWKGTPTFCGSQAFKGYVAENDAPISAAWRKAGIIPIGKSTSPEIGLTATTEPIVTGPSRNPWNTDHSTGGSSGGAGALVAARVVPFAHATDGGGSIRIPASCNGVFGLKPSRGRTYLSASQPPIEISVSHAETITVRDSVAVFRINQTGNYDDIGMISGPSTRRLKIGLMTEPANGSAVDPEVKTATENVAQMCRDLGHEVIPFQVPETFDYQGFIDQFILYWSAGAADFAQQASQFAGKPMNTEILEPLTLYLASIYMTKQEELPAAIAGLQAFEAIYNSWFADMDVLLTPTLPRLPFRIGELGPDVDPEAHFAKVSDYAAFTPLMNVSGAASMSVPLAWSASGLPIGMMFSGKRGDDGLLFELAYELEQARPWIDKIPPVHA